MEFEEITTLHKKYGEVHAMKGARCSIAIMRFPSENHDCELIQFDRLCMNFYEWHPRKRSGGTGKTSGSQMWFDSVKPGCVPFMRI